MFESFLGINFLNLYDTDAFLAIQIILTLTINCAIFKRNDRHSYLLDGLFDLSPVRCSHSV